LFQGDLPFRTINDVIGMPAARQRSRS
jgi:hypothetical protein